MKTNIPFLAIAAILSLSTLSSVAQAKYFDHNLRAISSPHSEQAAHAGVAMNEGETNNHFNREYPVAPASP